MAAKKKAASKKSTETKTKRPPRSLYVTYNVATGNVTQTYIRQANAEADRTAGEQVAGPYILAERVGQD